MSAGVLDAGLASMATFVLGLVAARDFNPSLLGAYALFFTAFTLVAVVSAQLVWVPFEARSVVSARADRIGMLGPSLRVGAPVAALSALAIPFVALLADQSVSTTALIDLAATATVCTVLSPAQDHLRRVLHLAGHSGQAAKVSLVQLIVVAVTIVAMLVLDVRLTLVPFGALALANAASLVVGLWIVREDRRAADFDDRPSLSALAATGRWLLLNQLLPAGANFLSSVIVVQMTTAAVLGYAEAARVAGHPVLVFTTGFSAVLNPRSLEAGAFRRRGQAARTARSSNLLTLAFAVGFTAVFGFDWALNPLAYIVPKAYAIAWLTPTVILGNALVALSFPHRAELVAAGRSKVLAGVAGAACVAQVAVAFTAPVTRTFARPLGQVALGLVRYVGQSRARSGLYVRSGGAEGGGEQDREPGP